MSGNTNNKDNFKPSRTAITNKPKSRLIPDAQRLILEKDTVNKIKDDVDYANAFFLRSFRLSLQMEEY
jgi:hypothetical protein